MLCHSAISERGICGSTVFVIAGPFFVMAAQAGYLHSPAGQVGYDQPAGQVCFVLAPAGMAGFGQPAAQAATVVTPAGQIGPP